MKKYAQHGNRIKMQQPYTKFHTSFFPFLLLHMVENKKKGLYSWKPKSNLQKCSLLVFFLMGERGETSELLYQLISFLSLFSARLATLFCGSRTRACLKSAHKEKKFYKGVEYYKSCINILQISLHM